MKIPKYVWIIVAAAGAYYLYNKYKASAATIALGTPTVGTPTLPGTTSALNTASSQIGAGITSLFNQL